MCNKSIILTKFYIIKKQCKISRKFLLKLQPQKLAKSMMTIYSTLTIQSMAA